MSPGDAIDGKYQITRQLGEGGMGAVYEAKHLGTGRRVAVKVISGEELQKNAGMVARFQREARAAGAIESRHIAHVLDTGVDQKTGHPYLVMEFLQGQDLQQAIQKCGALAPDLTLRIVAQALMGLQKAHEAGVVHRDLKPANIFLTVQDGGEILVKLLDFGIAKVKMEHATSADNAALTRTGAMLGSPLYMSPEQGKGAKNVDHRTDIWSMGVVLYEALTGQTPYGHCDSLGGLFIAIASERPKPVQELAPWVPAEVAAVVHRAVEHDLGTRFQSAAEMLAAIRPLLRHGTSVDESMLQPLSPSAKAVAAERLPVPGRPASSIPDSDSGPSLPYSGRSPHAVSTGGPLPATTAPGMATSQVRSPPSRAAAMSVVVIGALAMVSGGAYAAYRFVQHGARPAPTALAVLPPPPGASFAPDPTTAPLAPSVAATTTVQVTVTPSTASVEVDGAQAPVTSGHVDVTGLLGSTHRLRVYLGKKEMQGDVVISSTGAVPATMDLGAKPMPAVALGGPPVASNPKGPAAPPAGPPTQPATAPAKPPPPPGGGAVDRDFH